MSELTFYCIGCNANLGSQNPRQYCRKTYCPVIDEQISKQESNQIHKQVSEKKNYSTIKDLPKAVIKPINKEEEDFLDLIMDTLGPPSANK